MIFVTHDLQLAGRHASHLAVFKNRQVKCGPVGETLTGENLEMAFGVPTEVRPEASGGYIVQANVEQQEILT